MDIEDLHPLRDRAKYDHILSSSAQNRQERTVDKTTSRWSLFTTALRRGQKMSRAGQVAIRKTKEEKKLELMTFLALEDNRMTFWMIQAIKDLTTEWKWMKMQAIWKNKT